MFPFPTETIKPGRKSDNSTTKSMCSVFNIKHLVQPQELQHNKVRHTNNKHAEDRQKKNTKVTMQQWKPYRRVKKNPELLRSVSPHHMYSWPETHHSPWNCKKKLDDIESFFRVWLKRIRTSGRKKSNETRQYNFRVGDVRRLIAWNKKLLIKPSVNNNHPPC